MVGMYGFVQLLEPCLPQLCEYLTVASTAGPTLQVLLQLAEKKPQLLVDCLSRVKQAAFDYPSTLCLVARVVSAVGKLSKVGFFLFFFC